VGVAEIVIFAVCWLVVASLMLWGVFTEHKRDGRESRRSRHADWHPVRAAPTDWIVLETAAGAGPEVEVRARLIASALLASRGVDLEMLPPGDLKVEVTTASDGAGTTRVLVRAGAIHASRRHH
jgi:archaellum component FlaG (FlaF/FlaG flagellin family)